MTSACANAERTKKRQPISPGRLFFLRTCVEAVLSLSLVAVGVAAPARAQFLTQVVPPANDYFRFKAKYVVKASGETIKFDLVRPCTAKYAQAKGGGTVDLGPFGSDKMKPSDYFGPVDLFPKVTGDHHALVIKIPRMCDGQTTANGRVPSDAMPFVSWYEDADDVTDGLMYATEDAYRSPLAKIVFEGASVETATESDFVEWIRRAPDGFRPSKDITSPLGFTQLQVFHDGPIPQACTGFFQVEIPPHRTALVDGAWAPDRPRFWARTAKEHPELDALEFELIRQRPRIFNGQIKDFAQTFNGASIFPFGHKPNGMRSAVSDKEKRIPLYFDVDLKPEMKGFLSCKRTKSIRYLYPEVAGQVVESRVNGEIVAGIAKKSIDEGQISEFYEQDVNVYFGIAI